MGLALLAVLLTFTSTGLTAHVAERMAAARMVCGIFHVRLSDLRSFQPFDTLVIQCDKEASER